MNVLKRSLLWFFDKLLVHLFLYLAQTSSCNIYCRCRQFILIATNFRNFLINWAISQNFLGLIFAIAFPALRLLLWTNSLPSDKRLVAWEIYGGNILPVSWNRNYDLIANHGLMINQWHLLLVARYNVNVWHCVLLRVWVVQQTQCGQLLELWRFDNSRFSFWKLVNIKHFKHFCTIYISRLLLHTIRTFYTPSSPKTSCLLNSHQAIDIFPYYFNMWCLNLHNLYLNAT